MDSPTVLVTTIPLSSYPVIPGTPRLTNVFRGVGALFLAAAGIAGTVYAANVNPGYYAAWESTVLGGGLGLLLVTTPSYRYLFARRALRLSGRRGWIFSRGVRAMNGDLLWRQREGYFTMDDTLRVHLSSRVEEIPSEDVVSVSRLEGGSGLLVRPLLRIRLADGSEIDLEIVHGNPKDTFSTGRVLIDRAVASMNAKRNGLT